MPRIRPMPNKFAYPAYISLSSSYRSTIFAHDGDVQNGNYESLLTPDETVKDRVSWSIERDTNRSHSVTPNRESRVSFASKLAQRAIPSSPRYI